MSDQVVPTSDARVAEFLAAARDQEPVDPQQAALDIVRRILSADAVEDVLKVAEAVHARDVLGDVLTITGFQFNESAIGGDGPAFYMLIECVDGNGEAFKVTCGALNVMAQLFRLNQLGALPGRFRIVESENATRAGFKPMWLEGVSPADAAASTAGGEAPDF